MFVPNRSVLGAPHAPRMQVLRRRPVLARVDVGREHAEAPLLIFLTIIYFGNEMTAESAGGVVVVVCGVGLYNWARVRYPAPAADDEVPSAGDKDDACAQL